ncbi:MAG: DNA polymerase I [Akkermansia sp.]|nr:DNA polymerase I [Akkermansia sp.]
MRAMETLYILDGMALMYRAFYAFINAPMRTSAGLNTSAMFGFTNTVLSLIEKESPTHIVACLDPSGPTFRHEQYPEYKANRQAMPKELRDSIPWIIEILKAMRIPVVRVPGFEADDLIGTFTRLADERGDMHAYMVSLDKDLGQLLSPTCSFHKPGKKGADFEVIHQADFLAEWGISEPRQIIDILALMGDASDNIPGVPGVGAVTARKLVAQFGSVQNMLEHTADIKGKLREKIETNAANARLSYELATIRRDAPLPISITDCARVGYDIPALRAIFAQLEFRGLDKRLGAAAPDDLFAAAAAATEPAATEGPQQLDLFAAAPSLTDINNTPHTYKLIRTPEEQAALAAELTAAPRWAFDTETTGLDPLQDRMLGMSFCLKPGVAYYVPVDDGRCPAVFLPAFAGGAEKVGLNLKFDLQVLHTAGAEVAGPFFDAMLAHAALYPELRHNMDDMAEALLNYRTVHLSDIAGKDCNTAAVPVEQMADYAAEDADVTLRLADVLAPQLESAGQTELMRDIEFPLVPVLAAIEQEGMRVEPEQLLAASAELGEQITAISTRIDEVVGRPINLNSPRQLGDLLFGELKLLAKPKKTKTGQYVTDEETLRKLAPAYPLVQDILEYRELSKLKGTYLDALPRYISPVDGRIHSSLQQMVTATGRLASQNPNLQNIPVRSDAGKLIRRAFIARGEEYSILSADYSQVELRLMAALSADPAMITAFTQGRDIHAETAARIYGVERGDVTPDMRRAAKTVNFGIIYGISAFGLSQRLDCPRGEAAALIESYFTQFPGVKSCMDSLIATAREKGYAETLCGRRRRLPDLNSSNFNLRAAAERNAINTPIQGSAADMIKIAMVRVHNLLRGRKSRLIMQIHDELLFDLHRDEHDLIPQIIETMQGALPLPHGVPLEVEANHAPNWLEAH